MYELAEIKDLREQRRKLGEDVRSLYKKAKDEKRTLTAEEDTQVDTMLADAEKLKVRHERMEKADGLLEDLGKSAGRKAPATEPERRTEPGEEIEEGNATSTLDVVGLQELNALLRSLGANADAIERRSRKELRNIGRGARDTKEYREVFGQYLLGEAGRDALIARANQIRLEHRDLQVDNETQAGALVPPQMFVAELIKNLDDETYLRQWARGFTIANAQSLGAPKRTAKASTWTWGSELADPTATRDTTLAFGTRELYPRHASGLIKASRPFLRAALLNPEEIIRYEIARDGSELLEQAMLTGSAAGQPLGVFTSSADGISTARDVSTGNSTTEVSLTGLREAKYSIKAPYWPGLRWLGSRTFHKQLYSMDDGDGRPLFVESVKVGEVDRVLSFPVFISEFAPNTFTTGKYVAILGDWYRGYWYADALNMELQRLDELYALSNQVGFIARLQTDGMPVLEECWARVKLG